MDLHSRRPLRPRTVLAGILAATALVAGAPAALAQDPLLEPISNADELVQSWYVSVLGRGPANAADDVGREGWVSAVVGGTRSDDVVTELASSREYVQDHVEATYRDVLRRRADPGARFWVDQVVAGRLTLDDVDRAVLASPELATRWDSSFAGRDRYVQDLYVAVLGRYVWDTSPGERAWWVDRIDAVDAPVAVAELWATREAVEHRIDHVYRLMLRRPADSYGLRYWRGVESSRGLVAVIAGVGASSEYLTVDWKQPYQLDTGKGPYPFPYYPKNNTEPRLDAPPLPKAPEPSPTPETSPPPTP